MKVTLSLLGGGLRRTVMGVLPAEDGRSILNGLSGDNSGPDDGASKSVWAGVYLEMGGKV
jgi:hypothetical protein